MIYLFIDNGSKHCLLSLVRRVSARPLISLLTLKQKGLDAENNKLKVKQMINLGFMNYAVELTDGNEFRLLYVIANTISLKKEGHTKIYRDMLADRLNLSTKQITRLTDSLVEKGLLKKDLVSENSKTVCYYSLNLDKIGKKTSSKVDKNVPLNKKEKEVIKRIKENKIEKEQKVDVKREFQTTCEVDEEELRQYQTTCSTRLPNEMNLNDYLRAVGRN
jgi:DNA-binding MarR family transcriptional regulator